VTAEREPPDSPADTEPQPQQAELVQGGGVVNPTPIKNWGFHQDT